MFGALRYHIPAMRRPALFFVLFLTCSAFAQVRPVSAGDLSLLIIPAKSAIHADDSLLIKVEVTNISNDVVLFRADDLCLNPGAGLTLKVTDSSGHELKNSVPLTCVSVPDQADRDAFVHLSPDAFYGRLIRIQATRIAPKPGRYELTFTLRGTVLRKDVAQIINAEKTPTVAFTSECEPLVFKLPIQLAP
jgi:hypothetical protein